MPILELRRRDPEANYQSYNHLHSKHCDKDLTVM